MTSARAGRLITVASGVLSCCGLAAAQTVSQTKGPDVIVGDLPDVVNNAAATVNGVVYDSFAMATTSCNRGNVPINWYENDNRHPAICQNIFRLASGQFEQLGQGWLKHGFYAEEGSDCSAYFSPVGCVMAHGGDGTALGTGCSDPYNAQRNDGGAYSMGPKWQVDAATGLFPYPFASSMLSAAPRMRLSELNASPAGSRFFAEGQYIVGDDAAAKNNNNNASWREVNVTASTGTIPNATQFNVALTSGQAVHREQPAIYAWAVIDPLVHIVTVDVPNDGQFILAYKVTGPVSGLYTYEYALHNLNSHRCAGSFYVPLPEAQNALTGIGFHDVEAVGEPNDFLTPTNPAASDWTVTGGTANAGNVTWSGPAYAGTPPIYTMDPTTPFHVASFTPGTGNDHTANVLRWGTLFNFRFTSEIAPGDGSIGVGLWRPGVGDSFTMPAATPAGAVAVGELVAICCTGEGCTIVAQTACTGGSWGVPADSCMPNPCASGACCTDGACTSTIASACAAPGIWTMGGSCSPNVCPVPTGACCAAGSCAVVMRTLCSATFQGSNSTCSSAPCPSGSDSCSGATWIADGIPASGSTASATFSSADLNNASQACGSATNSPDVWFKYKPTAAGSVNFNTCGSDFDTVLSLYGGSCGAFTQLACNDDSYNGGNGVCGQDVTQSGFNYTVAANTTYFLRVAGYGGETGDFVLNVIGGQGVIPSGACCSSAGVCSLVVRAACPTGSTWNGAASCSPQPCPQVSGACCNGTTCSAGLQSACTGAFQGAGSTCGAVGNPTTCCPANYNGVGNVNVQDIFDFLAGWFSGAPAADFNHTGGITVQDIFDFLSAWFAGC